MQKTMLITGATDGIGFETAKMLAKQGHYVLLHGRNEDKLKKLEQALLAHCETATFESYCADLSNMSEVIALAQAVTEKHQHLDILINNAGVYNVDNSLTVDGLDPRFAVNTVAPYLLTHALLPLMNKVSRVLNLSSAAQSTVNINALRGLERLGDSEAYAQSKLALTMWSRVMGLALKAKGPVIIAINPKSLLGSKMVKEAFGISGSDLSIGAEVLCQAALCDDFAHASGLYFDNDHEKFSDPHPDALNEDKCRAVVTAIQATINKDDFVSSMQPLNHQL
ncbi:SDR family NAD(P)-dependent oxidoreductase [Psychromonas marina]|nr:SDR family NAD(P)-dependent oxidoreductase [Psychromonas marina]